MPYLLDTGILLRLADLEEARHEIVSKAVSALLQDRQDLFVTTQNFSEFYNVATRPISNNGLGREPADAIRLIECDLEPICSVLTEPVTLFEDLKRLLAAHRVVGKQVHDARLVAAMLAWRIDHILTLNDRDFRRYESAMESTSSRLPCWRQAPRLPAADKQLAPGRRPGANRISSVNDQRPRLTK